MASKGIVEFVLLESKLSCQCCAAACSIMNRDGISGRALLEDHIWDQESDLGSKISISKKFVIVKFWSLK